MAKDKPRCGAKRKQKPGPCENYPRIGATRCGLHGGASPQVKRKAERVKAETIARKAMESYGQKIDINPIDALLDEVRWTAGHVAWLRERVQEIEQASLVWGTTSMVSKAATEFPGTDSTEEAKPNIWLTLYQQERKHLLDACKAAIAAGIDERRVRLAEQQGDLIVQVLQGILGDLNLTPAQQDMVPEVASRHLALVAGNP